MSRKPTIKISYPEASSKALQLTEAMVKRAPGERVVRTESEDPVFPDGGELFSSFIRCKTQTGVDLTLTLNPSSMDYALETLIRPNLTADERKQILGEEPETADLIPPAQAAEAPGQALDGSSSPDVPSADESATQSGEQGDRYYSYKTFALFGAILAAIESLKTTKNPSPQNTLALFGMIAQEHLEKNKDDAEKDFLDAYQMIYPRRNVYPKDAGEAEVMIADYTKTLYNLDHRIDHPEPSWDDVEAEARQMQVSALKQSAAPRADEDTTNMADTTDTTDDIEPGLLDDLDDESDGMAPAGEVMGHDE